MAMTIGEACGAVAAARGDAIVVATMSAMFAFDQLALRDGRMGSVPLMGGAAGLGLGLALARKRALTCTHCWLNTTTPSSSSSACVLP